MEFIEDLLRNYTFDNLEEIEKIITSIYSITEKDLKNNLIKILIELKDEIKESLEYREIY